MRVLLGTVAAVLLGAGTGTSLAVPGGYHFIRPPIVVPDGPTGLDVYVRLNYPLPVYRSQFEGRRGRIEILDAIQDSPLSPTGKTSKNCYITSLEIDGTRHRVLDPPRVGGRVRVALVVDGTVVAAAHVTLSAVRPPHGQQDADTPYVRALGCGRKPPSP